MIRICMTCQTEQKLDPYINKAIEKGIDFTHGLCIHHYVKEALSRGRSKKQIDVTVRQILAKGFKPAPYLKKFPNLVKQYKQGIFKES